MRGAFPKVNVDHPAIEAALPSNAETPNAVHRQADLGIIYRQLKRGADDKASARLSEMQPLTVLQRDKVVKKASQYGRLEFLKRHADGELSEQAKQIALYLSAGYGQTEVCRFWWEEGVDIHAKVSRYRNPYPNKALRHGHVNTAAFFFGKGVSVEEPDGYFFDRPIHVSSYAQLVEGLQLLHRLRADINSKTGGRFRQTALHIDAYYNLHDCGKVLLEMGADPNIPDASGRHPLNIARKYGHKKLARLLEEHGAIESENVALHNTSKNGLARWEKHRIDFDQAAHGF